MKDEDVIKESKKGSKHKQHRRLPLYPEMEERLYHEYKDLGKKGIKVKGYWFRIFEKHILEETSPKNELHVCQILGSKALNIDAELVLDELQTPVKGHLKRSKWQSKVFIEESARSLSQRTENKQQILGSLGSSTLQMLTRLLFHFDRETYSDTGGKTVRVRGASSGLEKRQCTVQVTLFADGVPRVKPI